MGEDARSEPRDEDDEPVVGVYTCPHCQQQVAVDADEPHPFITCPYCGGEFAVPKAEDAERSAEDAAEAERRRLDEASREDELSGMRIKQISTMRRTAIRGISYLWVGVFLCLGAVGGLIQKAHQRTTIERKWDLRTFAFLAGATASLFVAGYFYRNLRKLREELKRPLLEEPTTPPDFSTLSDGTQQWRNLDEVK